MARFAVGGVCCAVLCSGSLVGGKPLTTIFFTHHVCRSFLMSRPVACRAVQHAPPCTSCVLMLLFVLILQTSHVEAARGNSLRDHVLHGMEARAEAATPAWQHPEFDETMDAGRRLLEEYALNAAEDFIAPTHVGDEITKARLMLEEYSMQAAEETFLQDAEAVLKNLDENHLTADQTPQAEAQVPAAEDMQGALTDVPVPPAAPSVSTSSVQEDPNAGQPEVSAPAVSHDDSTMHALRRLLQVGFQNATKSSESDNRSPWEQLGEALLTIAPLLEQPAAEVVPAQPQGAVAQVPEDQDASLAGKGRRLMQAGAVNVTQLKEQAKQVLLASDSFGVVYAGGNFARAIFALLMPMVVAGQTGTIAVDANYVLNLSQLLAQFIAMLGDLLSKGARLTADGIAPV